VTREGTVEWRGARPRAGAAFFDLDRTLISGSSAFVFAVAAWRRDLVPTRSLLRDAGGAAVFKHRGSTDDKVARLRERALRAVRGSRQADLVTLNAVILPKLLSRVRPEAERLVDMHQRAGRDTYIVSASPAEVVEPLAAALGMTGGIGTRSEVDADGVYTGALAGPFVYGEGKLAAIREIAEWERHDLALSYAYSDSVSDLPMLEGVGHPVAVNPDNPLAREAHDRGWPIVIFRRRTRIVVRRTTTLAGAAAVAGGAFAAGLQLGRRRPDTTGLDALTHR
jgi:HAD superfamily hydrolase (TIGR01490 family)